VLFQLLYGADRALPPARIPVAKTSTPLWLAKTVKMILRGMSETRPEFTYNADVVFSAINTG